MSITNPQVVPPLRRHKLRPSRRKIQTVDALLYPHALITEPVVIQVSGLSGATLERQVHAGEFPAPRKFGRFKRWVAGEITDWLKAQADGRKWAAKSRDQSGDIFAHGEQGNVHRHERVQEFFLSHSCIVPLMSLMILIVAMCH